MRPNTNVTYAGTLGSKNVAKKTQIPIVAVAKNATATPEKAKFITVSPSITAPPCSHWNTGETIDCVNSCTGGCCCVKIAVITKIMTKKLLSTRTHGSGLNGSSRLIIKRATAVFAKANKTIGIKKTCLKNKPCP